MRFCLLLCLFLSFELAHAWSGHSLITRLSLQTIESWDAVTFEPIESVLPHINVEKQKAAVSRAEFAEQLAIHGDKVNWDWKPVVTKSKVTTALDVLTDSVEEPDNGMDQNLNLVDYQEYMGGYTGLASQGPRHMFYPKFDWFSPIATFHLPFRELFNQMGFAPDRAQLFFDLATQAKNTGHKFWAYRFLGWGLHYVQDLGQPYHANQFGSPMLFAIFKVFQRSALITETKRRVSNFHISFEEYTDYLLRNDRDDRSTLASSFLVPNADPGLQETLNRRPASTSVIDALVVLAKASGQLSPKVVWWQNKLIGKELFDAKTDLSESFTDTNGRPKIDFFSIDHDEKLTQFRNRLYALMFKALSNTAIATRWYVQKL